MVASRLHALSPSHLVSAWGRATVRFPVAAGASLLLTLILILLIHEAWGSGKEAERWISIGMGLGCTVLGGLGATLLAEVRGWSRWLGLGLGAALGVVCVTSFALIPVETALETLAFLAPGLFLLALTAVLMGPPGAPPEAGWFRALTDLTACFFGIVVAVILGAGLSAWFATIDLLLGANIPGELYGDVWVVCLVLIWTLTALSRLHAPVAPKTQPAAETPLLPGWLAILIAGPLTLLALGYLAVVVLYLIRLMLEDNLLGGEVGLTTSIYLAYGMAVHLLSFPLREEGPALSRLYYKFFAWTLPLPLAALVAALWIRISTYGWTESRYLVVMLALWLTLFCLHFLLHRRSTHPALVPGVLGAMMVLAAFGPWSATSVAISSQITQLGRVIDATGLRDWQGDPKHAPPLDEALQTRLYSLYYWLNRRDALDQAATRLDLDWESLRGVISLPSSRDHGAELSYHSITVAPANSVVIAGYDHAAIFSHWPPGHTEGELAEGQWRYRLTPTELFLYDATGDKNAPPLAQLDLRALAARLGTPEDRTETATPDALSLTLTTPQGLRLKVQLLEATLELRPDTAPTYSFLRGVVLVGTSLPE